MVRYVAPDQALVKDRGRTGVLVSSVPLARRDGASLRAVDLGLRRSAAGFSPAFASVASFIPDRLSAGIAVGGVRVTPAGVSSAAATALGGNVFYANVATDTDFMVAPMPDGVETYWVLRSASSPTTETLSLTLPTGERVAAASGMAVIRRGGRTIGTITEPVATDASGANVPVVERVVGDRITLAVAPSASTRFPVEVDPRFSFGGYGPYVGPGNFIGWSFRSTGSGAFAASDPGSAPQSVTAVAGRSYAAGSAGEWIFKAPGTSYLYELDYGGLNHTGSDGAEQFFGIYSAAGTSTGGSYYANGTMPPTSAQPYFTSAAQSENVGRVCTTSYYNGAYSLCPVYGTPGDEAIFGLYTTVSGTYASNDVSSAGGLEMMLGDAAAPTTPSTNIPAGGGAVDRLNVTSTQGGLGISDISVSFPAGGTGPGTSMLDYPITCENGSSPFAYCPLSETVTFGAGLPNGTYTAHITVTAAGGATATAAPALHFASDSGTPSSTTGQANQTLSPTETEGGGNPSELPCQPCGGDPVNTATGDYYSTVTDLAFPGQGPSFQVSRSYSSLAAASGATSPFGHGWASSYAMTLATAPATGAVTITNADGSQTVFAPNGAGGFTAPPRVLATLVENSDGSYDYTIPRDREVFAFSSAGKLASITDLNGNAVTLTYNTAGQLSAAADHAGQTITFAYNTAGLVASATDSTGRTVGYTYSSAGDLASVTDVRGGTTNYTYNSTHLLLTVEDPDGHTVTTNTYDSAARVTAQQDARGHTTTFAYSGTDPSQATITRVTDPNGNITEYAYAGDVLTSKTTAFGTPQAATWSYTYDPNTLGGTSVTDPDGRTATYTYDQNGNQTSATDADGHTTTATYDALDDRTALTDAAGVTTTYTYDAHGNQVERATPISSTSTQTTHYAYASTAYPGALTSTTSPNGYTTSFTYDSNGYPASTTDPDGNEATFTYNARGYLTSATAPRGNLSGATPAAYTTTYTYDAAGDKLTRTDPLGHVTTWTYDADGRTTTLTDASGHETQYTYDAAGDLTTTTRPDATTLTNSYDANGNLASQTKGAGHATTYTYDARNKLTATTDPLTRTTTYGYDAAGNQTSVTDASGRITTYTYDPANLLTGASYSSGTPGSDVYTYDADGRQLTSTDGTGTTTRTYDALGRVTAITDGNGDAITYSYDLDSNRTAMTYPGGHTVTMAYDAADRETSLEDWLGNTTTFAYDADSNLTTTTFPTATNETDTRTYDDADQTATITDTAGTATLAAKSYTRDNLGQTTAESDSGLPTSGGAYAYNTLNQLTSENTAPLAYDNAGNATDLNGATGYTYDNASQLTSAPTPGTSTATTYSFDTEGERTATTPPATLGNPTSYAYNQAGQLTTVSRSAFGSGTGAIPATSATYTYNANGVAQAATTAGTTKQLTWDAANELPLLLKDGGLDIIYGPGQQPIEQIDAAGTVLYYHADAQGSIRMLTSSSGTVVGTYAYNAYGELSASTGTATTPLGYDGQYTDRNTGLIYLRARWYDPATAQFLTQDPLQAVTQEPYAYAQDNPLNLADPTGLDVLGIGHFVSTHKVLVGATLGVLAVATGGASLLAAGAFEATTAAGGLALVATASGLGAVAIDGGDCISHPGLTTACAATALGATAALASAPELGVSLGLISEPPFQEFTAIAFGGLFVGGAATLTDLGAAIYQDATAGGTSCGPR